jgi:hypothetical protein
MFACWTVVSYSLAVVLQALDGWRAGQAGQVNKRMPKCAIDLRKPNQHSRAVNTVISPMA